MRGHFQISRNTHFASIVFSGFRIPGRNFSPDILNSPVELNRNCWISYKPPFTIDQEWRKWIGEIISERIKNGRFVLTAVEESSSDSDEILLNRIQLVLWGISIVIGIPEYWVADTIKGFLQENESIQTNISFGFGMTRLFQTVCEKNSKSESIFVPIEITLDEFNQAVQFATYMETINKTIEQERKNRGIPVNQSYTNLFTRPKGGFMAFQLGAPSSFAPERLHQFARTIEACLPADIGGRQDFTGYLKDLLIPHSDNDNTLLEIYDLRSAQEHIRPFDCRALPKESDPDSIARRRTRQSEALAREMFKRFFSGQDLLSHFRDETTLKAFWTNGNAVRAWGPKFDLQGIL
jgi:hypothetical protein